MSRADSQWLRGLLELWEYIGGSSVLSGDKLSGQVKSRPGLREWDRHSKQGDMAHTEEQGGKGECYRCRKAGYLVSLELWLKAAGATKEESEAREQELATKGSETKAERG